MPPLSDYVEGQRSVERVILKQLQLIGMGVMLTRTLPSCPIVIAPRGRRSMRLSSHSGCTRRPAPARAGANPSNRRLAADRELERGPDATLRSRAAAQVCDDLRHSVGRRAVELSGDRYIRTGVRGRRRLQARRRCAVPSYAGGRNNRCRRAARDALGTPPRCRTPRTPSRKQKPRCDARRPRSGATGDVDSTGPASCRHVCPGGVRSTDRPRASPR